jgi:hypothetical protein
MMKTIRKMALVGVLGVMLSSCASLFNFNTVADNAARIQPGMTKDEVTDVMGRTPNFRRFSDGRDEWEYRTLLNNDDYDVVVIDFYNGRVTSMDSFREVRHHYPQPNDEKK